MYDLISILSWLGVPVSVTTHGAIKPDDWYSLRMTAVMIGLTIAYYWHQRHYEGSTL